LTHRFWLIRHALVHPVAMSNLYGANDVPLCEDTMAADAPRYAALAARLPHPARLVCSTLSRTWLTAAALTKAGYPGQSFTRDAAFVEQDFGDFQGQPVTDFDVRENGRHPFWPINAAETPPHGESFDAMIARVGAGLERLLATAKPDQRHTVIVSHGGAIRAAVAYALGLTAHQALCLAVENISLTRLNYHDGDWRLVSLNEQLAINACESSPAVPITAAQQGVSA
jgi:broad specificity phosphatase PhoE